MCTIVPPALKARNLDHRDMDRFYAAAAALDMPLGVHGAPGIHLPKIGVDRFDNYIQVHCVSFPFDQMFAMTALVSGGVFDRHPTLRVAFLEAGAGWLPWFIERLGEHHESRGDWIPNGWQRPPAEYVAAGNVIVTCEPDEDALAVRGGATRRPVRDVRQRLPPLGRGVAAGIDRIEGTRRRATGPGVRWPGWPPPTPRTSTTSLGDDEGRR